MPIYEYVCMQCESHFEELVRNGDDPGCPDCGGANVRRQLSVFAASVASGEGTVAFGDSPRAGSGGCCGGSCGCG
jgi:putative FmdB family regulatory protein